MIKHPKGKIQNKRLRYKQNIKYQVSIQIIDFIPSYRIEIPTSWTII
jgi:hypothetical protein